METRIGKLYECRRRAYHTNMVVYKRNKADEIYYVYVVHNILYIIYKKKRFRAHVRCFEENLSFIDTYQLHSIYFE